MATEAPYLNSSGLMGRAVSSASCRLGDHTESGSLSWWQAWQVLCLALDQWHRTGQQVSEWVWVSAAQLPGLPDPLPPEGKGPALPSLLSQSQLHSSVSLGKGVLIYKVQRVHEPWPEYGLKTKIKNYEGILGVVGYIWI